MDSNCRFSLDRIDNVAVILSATLAFIAINRNKSPRHGSCRCLSPSKYNHVGSTSWTRGAVLAAEKARWLFEAVPLSELSAWSVSFLGVTYRE